MHKYGFKVNMTYFIGLVDPKNLEIDTKIYYVASLLTMLEIGGGHFEKSLISQPNAQILFQIIY
jgi:hypothetical protein